MKTARFPKGSSTPLPLCIVCFSCSGEKHKNQIDFPSQNPEVSWNFVLREADGKEALYRNQTEQQQQQKERTLPLKIVACIKRAQIPWRSYRKPELTAPRKEVGGGHKAAGKKYCFNICWSKKRVFYCKKNVFGAGVPGGSAPG